MYLETDASSKTGYKESVWTGMGMNYMVEAGNLYFHPANDNAWSWTEIGSDGISVVNNGSSCIYTLQK